MRIPSGTTDQGFYFVAVDPTDLKTRETGLTGFTVYRSRNNAAAVAMTTPTTTEVSATNMPGVYFLLCDEDMTIGSGNDSEEMVFHITHAGMAPVTRTIELYRPKVTLGETVSATSAGRVTANVDQWRGSTPQVLVSGFVQAQLADISLAGEVDVANAVWNRAQANHVTAGSFGEIATEIAAILVDTAEIGAAGSGLTEAGGTGDHLTALPLNDISAADVNAQMVDALNVDTYAEPGQGAPAATASLVTKIGHLYKMLRNRKEQTATTFSLYNDAQTVVDQKATVSSDGTTAVRDELVTGP